MGDIQDHFPFAVWVDQAIAEGFPANVHVRAEGEQFALGEFFRERSCDAMVGGSWRDAEVEGHGTGGFDFVSDVFGICQEEADLAQILLRGSVGCVVDLEDQFAICWNSLCITFGHNLRAGAGNIADQERTSSA